MPQEKHTSKTDAETRNFLYCLAGAVGTLLCCDIVRAGFYVFTDPPIAMGAAFLIILLSPQPMSISRRTRRILTRRSA